MLVVGAGGAVGEAIAHALLASGCDVVAAMRRDRPAAAMRLQAAGARMLKLDIESTGALANALADVDGVALTPILAKSVRAAPPIAARGVRSVFFSSNNVAVDAGNPVYAALKDAETQIRSTLPNAAILRPTLIYGDPRLIALPRLIRFLRRSPILPIPGDGRALQQPIFHEDIARVAAAALLGETLQGKTCAIGGPDIMSQRDMYLRLSRLLGGVRLPVPAPRALLRALRIVGRAPLNDAQIARLDADKIAVPVDSLPEQLAPLIGWEEGLRRLIAAQDALAFRAWRAAEAAA